MDFGQALRWLLLGTVSLAATSAVAAEPLMQRIASATVASVDLEAFEARYENLLGYRVRERGNVSAALAASWGAPKAAGRRYVLMSADGWKDVFIRAVEAPPVEGYVPITTWGWNSIEIIVDDPIALRRRFEAAPFRVIGEPRPLNSYPSIVAFQVVGPDQEVLYLTAETGDRERSTLPLPRGDVGRPFIMVVAGPDIEVLLDWYSSRFSLVRGDSRPATVRVVQGAQGLDGDATIGLGLMRLGEHGNLIEFDGYSSATSGPRPFRAGDLPPGIAMTSFVVEDLSRLELPYIAKPTVFEGIAYGGRRAATVRGPTGELIELIER